MNLADYLCKFVNLYSHCHTYTHWQKREANSKVQKATNKPWINYSELSFELMWKKTMRLNASVAHNWPWFFSSEIFMLIDVALFVSLFTLRGIFMRQEFALRYATWITTFTSILTELCKATKNSRVIFQKILKLCYM